ncbi:MAG TPA: hypothetical protein VJ810_34790 [Blastocatellia bacterium]|nr:hypothetical protein [Blastocatellia bacterium]
MNQEWMSQQAYVERVLQLYRQAPETPSRFSRLDRRLAEEFYERQIKIEEVEAAILLATVRRSLRSPEAPKLSAIRSLHYFVPVIEEVRSNPLSESYLEYLRRKLAAIGVTV